MSNRGLGTSIFILFLLVSSANLLMMLPIEREVSPMLRAMPWFVLAVPVLLAAGFHVTLYLIAAATVTAWARLSSPQARLAEFGVSSAAVGIAHTPLLLWAIVTAVLVGSTPPGSAETASSLAWAAVLRPAAWWGTAIVMTLRAMALEDHWKTGARLAIPVVLLLIAANQALTWAVSS